MMNKEEIVIQTDMSYVQTIEIEMHTMRVFL